MSSNSKILLAGFGIAFGLGSFVSYFLARLDLSQQPPPAIAASTPVPEKVKDKMVDIRTVKPVKSARELLGKNTEYAWVIPMAIYPKCQMGS